MTPRLVDWVTLTPLAAAAIDPAPAAKLPPLGSAPAANARSPLVRLENASNATRRCFREDTPRREFGIETASEAINRVCNMNFTVTLRSSIRTCQLCGAEHKFLHISTQACRLTHLMQVLGQRFFSILYNALAMPIVTDIDRL
jgi:hypothetical protein